MSACEAALRIVSGLTFLPATERTACQHPLERQLARCTVNAYRDAMSVLRFIPLTKPRCLWSAWLNLSKLRSIAVGSAIWPNSNPNVTLLLFSRQMSQAIAD